MTLSQLRSQIDALCRKYATELEVYRLRKLAHEFCDEMAEAVTGVPGDDRKAKSPMTVLQWAQILIKRMSDRGFRNKNLVALNDYLERCLDRRVLPQVNGVLRALLPKAVQRGLIPRPIDPVPF